MHKNRVLRAFALLLAALLDACGGGGGSGTASAPSAPPPAVRTLALFAGNVDGQGSLDAQGLAARFDGPSAVAVDPRNGIAYVADTNNHTIRKIAPDGTVTTFAGTVGVPGFVDGPPGVARFNNPSGVAVDSTGAVYVADGGNYSIRKIDSSGRVTTFAGTGHAASVDDPSTNASFGGPIAVDPFFNVYVVAGYTVRKFSPGGVATTIAGEAGHPDRVDGPPGQSRIVGASSLVSDGAGRIYIAGGDSIRVLGPDGVLSTLVASLPGAQSLAVDTTGALYVADANRYKLWKVTAQGRVLESPVAGSGSRGVGDGPGIFATIESPALAFDPILNRLVMVEPLEDVVRQLDLSTGMLTTIAGARPLPFEQNADGSGASAHFSGITDLTADASGNLFAPSGGGVIRKITPAASVTTIPVSPYESVGRVLAAGQDGTLYSASLKICGNYPGTFPCGVRLFSIGPSGSATAQDFSDVMSPNAIARDAAGNTYLAGGTDPLNTDGWVLKIDPAGKATRIWNGVAGGVAVDSSGVVYLADAARHVILRLDAGGNAVTVAGKPGEDGAVDGVGAAARFRSPGRIVIDPTGNLYVADRGNFLVRKVAPGGQVTTVAGTPGSRGFISGALPGSIREPVGLAIVGADLFIAMPKAIAVVRNRP